jgi:acetyl esterase
VSTVRGIPLDPDLAKIVAAMRSASAPPPFSGTPPQARERLRSAIMAARKHRSLPNVGTTQDCLATHGRESVPVRIYRPIGPSGALPTVVFFHGGGFVLGSIELMDDIARKLCRDLDSVVVSVDYRLAPEFPFPAAHNDALTATIWALDNAGSLGGAKSCVAVAGESAGANLAASAAMMLRDRGLPLARIKAQLLIVPGADMARDTHALEASGADFPMLSPADLREVARLLMGDQVSQSVFFPPSPLRAAEFGDLPQAVIAVAGHDPLYEEGIAYARRLSDAGVPVDLLRFEDMFHPFFGFFDASASAQRANDEICCTFSHRLRGESS